jgi:hypothetical protein
MSKTLCKKDRKIKKNDIKYACNKCERKAEKKKHLCKPEKLAKNDN